MIDKMVRVVVPKGGTAIGTKIYTADGSEIGGVRSLEIFVHPEYVTTATIALCMLDMPDIEAHPLLTEETLQLSAEALGYDLVKRAAGGPVEQWHRTRKGEPRGYYEIRADGKCFIGVTFTSGRIKWSGPFLPKDITEEVLSDAISARLE